MSCYRFVSGGPLGLEATTHAWSVHEQCTSSCMHDQDCEQSQIKGLQAAAAGHSMLCKSALLRTKPDGPTAVG